jgi:hypothetical protein
MASKSHNSKKPKLATQPGFNSQLIPGADAVQPEKHHLTFAQHQHELAATEAAGAKPLYEAPAQHPKSDAQQHQQKPGSHK